MEKESEYSEKCIDQPCPFQGYTDTKKCWYHSRNVPLPKDAFSIPILAAPHKAQTFKEALIEEKALGNTAISDEEE